MPRRSPYSIVLTTEERKYLERIANQYTSPYYIVARAKIVFFEKRLGGLDDMPRIGRPSVFSP